MYSITENIYYSQLSSVAMLLQPEPVSHRIIQGKVWVLSPYVLSSCGLPLAPTCLLVTVNEAHSYFTSTIPLCPFPVLCSDSFSQCPIRRSFWHSSLLGVQEGSRGRSSQLLVIVLREDVSCRFLIFTPNKSIFMFPAVGRNAERAKVSSKKDEEDYTVGLSS
jgi:hypothetical protein